MTQSVTNKALLPVDNSLKTLEYRLRNKESMIFPDWSINRALKQVAADFNKLKEANQNLPKEELSGLLSRVDYIKSSLKETNSPLISVISTLWQRILPNKLYASVPAEPKQSKIKENLQKLEDATKHFRPINAPTKQTVEQSVEMTAPSEIYKEICFDLQIPEDEIDSILKDAAPLLEKIPLSDRSSIEAILTMVQQTPNSQPAELRAAICRGVASIIDSQTPLDDIKAVLQTTSRIITNKFKEFDIKAIYTGVSALIKSKIPLSEIPDILQKISDTVGIDRRGNNIKIACLIANHYIDKKTPTSTLTIIKNTSAFAKADIKEHELSSLFSSIQNLTWGKKERIPYIYSLIAPLIKPGMNYMDLVGIVAELHKIPSNNLIESLKSISEEASTFTNSLQVVLAIQKKVKELKQLKESQNTNSQNSISDKKTQIK